MPRGRCHETHVACVASRRPRANVTRPATAQLLGAADAEIQMKIKSGASIPGGNLKLQAMPEGLKRDASKLQSSSQAAPAVPRAKRPRSKEQQAKASSVCLRACDCNNPIRRRLACARACIVRRTVDHASHIENTQTDSTRVADRP
jgi:hypothetical protein